MRSAALICLACYGAHALFHLRSGHPEELLWACNVATQLVGLGLLLRAARPLAIGVLWLIFGDLMWALYLLGGGPFYPTSLLTHGGGLALGLWGARRLPWPRHAALIATLGLAALQGATRLLTPPAANVNLAFAIWTGWEGSFPSYAAYEGVLLGGAGAVFFCGDRLLRRRGRVT